MVRNNGDLTVIRDSVPVYTYVRRLVTQSVCSRAGLTKGEGGGGWLQREIDSSGVEKADSPVFLRLLASSLALSAPQQGRRLLEGTRGHSRANRVATWAFCPHLAACNKCIVLCAELHKDKETSGYRDQRGHSSVPSPLGQSDLAAVF